MKKKYVKDDCFFSMTFDYLNVFLPTQHQNSPNTVKAYTDGLSIFRRYITDDCKIPMEKFRFRDLTYDFLLDYRNLLVETGYAPTTVNHRLAVVSAYMHYAALRRPDLTQIYLNVKDVPYVTTPTRIRDIIEDEEALAMLLAAPSPSKLGVRDQTILTVLYDTAIRANELILLDLSDVNVVSTQPYVFIHGKGDKERIVEMSAETVFIIQQYLELYHRNRHNNRTPFFYTIIKGNLDRLSERTVERIVAKYADIVRQTNPNLPEKVTPHTLRRTRASGWYRDGVDLNAISKVLGHASLETTRRNYAKPSVEMLRKEMAKSQIPNFEVAEIPLWEDDEELAHLCGLR